MSFPISVAFDDGQRCLCGGSLTFWIEHPQRGYEMYYSTRVSAHCSRCGESVASTTYDAIDLIGPVKSEAEMLALCYMLRNNWDEKQATLVERTQESLKCTQTLLRTMKKNERKAHRVPHN